MRTTKSWIHVGALLLLAFPAAAGGDEPMPRFPGLPLEKMTIDTSHSHISFEAPFMAVSKVRGRFDEFRGMLLFDETNPTLGSIVLEIDPASISTANQRRDDHLRSDDFFDVEKFPTISFESERVEPLGDGYVAMGMLSCHGVTRQMQIPFRVTSTVPNDSWKNRRVVLNGGFRIDRRDFGIDGWEKKRFKPGAELIVAHEIDVTFEIHGTYSRLDTILDRLDNERLAFAKNVWNTLEAHGLQAALDTAREQAEASPTENLTNQLNGLAYAALERREIEVARALLNLGAELDPNDANTFDSLGEVALVAGETERARDYFEKSLKMDAANLNARIMLAWMER